MWYHATWSNVWNLISRWSMFYSLCIWIKNTLTFVILVADVICILSKNSQFFEIKIRPSKLYIWFLILFLKIEKFIHWESVKWTRLTFSKRAVISADLFFLVQCSLFLEVFQHVLCQSTNLNCTNSTDAKAKVPFQISLFLLTWEFYIVEVLTMHCDNLTFLQSRFYVPLVDFSVNECFSFNTMFLDLFCGIFFTTENDHFHWKAKPMVFYFQWTYSCQHRFCDMLSHKMCSELEVWNPCQLLM